MKGDSESPTPSGTIETSTITFTASRPSAHRSKLPNAHDTDDRSHEVAGVAVPIPLTVAVAIPVSAAVAASGLVNGLIAVKVEDDGRTCARQRELVVQLDLAGGHVHRRVPAGRARDLRRAGCPGRWVLEEEFGTSHGEPDLRVLAHRQLTDPEEVVNPLELLEIAGARSASGEGDGCPFTRVSAVDADFRERHQERLGVAERAIGQPDRHGRHGHI